MRLSWILLLATVLWADHKIEGPMPAEDGETCVVCYGRCNRNDIAYRVDGQRFPVMKDLEKSFLTNPDEYIARYKPNSMQFSGEQSQGMSDGYLLFGLFALVAVFCAGFYAHHLVMKRSGLAVAPAGLGKIPLTKAPVSCGACGALNHPSATACAQCGTAMTPQGHSEVNRTQ